VALPDARFSGRVAAVASRIDPETRTLRVRARIPNDDGRLRAGMSFTMRLPLDGQARPSVPSIAIQWEREGAFVWKVADGKAERVDVEVRRRTEAWVLVNAPLREGDRIVVEGIQSLDDGTPVRVKPGDGSPQMASEPADGA
jgi:RND family efflux transporter MFP subunit